MLFHHSTQSKNGRAYERTKYIGIERVGMSTFGNRAEHFVEMEIGIHNDLNEKYCKSLW